MINSYFELYILEGLFISWFCIFVINWVTAFKASTSIQPTVGVFLWVMSELDKNAYLRHNLVSVAHVRSADVDATAARRVTLFGLLLPDVEVDTMGWVVSLPLGTAVLSFLASWHIPNIKVFIVLESLANWNPGKTHAHSNGITERYMILVELESWEL